MTGFLLIDKPVGITSHDVIDRLRRITGIRTIGHAGTLDPFATGLLLVAIGRDATKTLSIYVGQEKEYEAEIRIGETTATLDPESPVTPGTAVEVNSETLSKALATLLGNLAQIPPMHAAIKVKGKKLYELARKGIEVVREPRAITVSEFCVIGAIPHLPRTTPFTLSTRIVCSSGTYVRALARDLGIALGTVGYLTALRRTRIGAFSLTRAVKLDALTPQNWIDALLSDMVPSTT